MIPRRRSPLTRTRLVAALALAALTLLAVGCGEKQDTTSPPKDDEQLDLVLDYFPNANHVGIYEALKDGEFADVGLDVRPRTPPDPSAPLKLLLSGRADIAISYEPELLLARDQGASLVSVGALAQVPLTSIIALGSQDITKPQDLRDTTVGTAGIPYQAAYLDTILERARVPRSSVERIDVGFNLVPAMLSKKVDSTLGAFWNYEGVQLEREGRDPSIIRMEQVGVPTYNELILVTRRETATKHGSRLRRFLGALGRGYYAARANPERAVDALVAANPDLDRGLQLAAVKASLPVFFPRAGKPFGWQDPAAWNAYGEWMYGRKLLRKPPNAGRALTNEFLPGQGA